MASPSRRKPTRAKSLGVTDEGYEAMHDRIGYVVVEWNQASGQPRLMLVADIYDDEADAWKDAYEEHRVNRENRRREHYGVAEVVVRGTCEDE